MTTFVDRVVLHVAAGDGGHGCSSVRREKFKPLGGPDGADGGNGGDVVLVVDHNVTTLLDYHYHPHQKATSGKPGSGDLRQGAYGTTLELPVPNGTVVYDESGAQLAVDYFGEPKYVFPRSDCALLPIANTTAEMLAQYLGRATHDQLMSDGYRHLTLLELEVEENYGQSATYRESLTSD